MLKLRDKEFILLKNVGIFAVFRLSEKFFKLEFVSEGFFQLLRNQRILGIENLKNPTLNQLFEKGFLTYSTFDQLARSFHDVVETGRFDILESGKDFNKKYLDFDYHGEDLRDGFDILHSYYYSELSQCKFVVHRIAPKNYISKKKLILEKRKIQKTLASNEYYKFKFFNDANKPIVMIDFNGKILEANKIFHKNLIPKVKVKKRSLNINDLILNSNDHLLVFKSLNELKKNYKDIKLKTKLIIGSYFDLVFSVFSGINDKTLVTVTFEESSYITNLEKVSTQKAYFMETVGILLGLFKKNITTNSLIKDGMHYINAIIESDIIQSYKFEEKQNVYNLILEQNTVDYSSKVNDNTEGFNSIVEELVENLKNNRPRLLHKDLVKDPKLKRLMEMACLSSVLILPTIKIERVIAVSFFGFEFKRTDLDLDKVSHYTTLVDMLLHESCNRISNEIYLTPN